MGKKDEKIIVLMTGELQFLITVILVEFMCIHLKFKISNHACQDSIGHGILTRIYFNLLG